MQTKVINNSSAAVGFILSFLAGSGLVWSIERHREVEPASDAPPTSATATSHASSPIPISPDDPAWGKADAPVTVVELSDFECPYCARVVPTVARLRELYGPEKLRIVWKNTPLPSHPNARPAADAAATVQGLGGNFWAFHDQVFSHQKELTPENLAQWAVAAGVKRPAFDAALASRRFSAKVDQDLALARQIGARSTPQFRINGRVLSGAQPLAKFQEVIDEQLVAAEALGRSGVPRGRQSLELTRKNFAASPPPAPPKPAAPPVEDTRVWNVPVASGDPVRGPADALVTIVQFSDFQCPYCSRVLPTLDRLQKKYPADVRMVWKDSPMSFHPRARPAATLARHALAQRGNAGFWAAHDALFQNQKQLDDPGLERVTEQLGLDWALARAAIESDRHAAPLDQGLALLNDLGAPGTPAFFINGRKLIGAQPYETFERIVEEQLGLARELVSHGVRRDRVFRELMRTAQVVPGAGGAAAAPTARD